MRSKILAGFLVGILFTGGAVASVVVEKHSRQMPDTAVLDCDGVNSFVFRGPIGTSRRAILVPPREYWTAEEAGLYSFLLRYESGNVCSRMVTPEVFARYRVGDDFYDRVRVRSDRYETDDSKAIQPVVQERPRTAQLRHRRQKHSSHRMAAKHRRHHRSHRVAQR